MVMLAGAVGTANTVFVNLIALFTLLHPADVYNTLALSPVAAATLLVNFILITCEFNVPESNDALAPKVPTNDHW